MIFHDDLPEKMARSRPALRMIAGGWSVATQVAAAPQYVSLLGGVEVLRARVAGELYR